MNAIDLFSGCGGLSYGFVEAGIDVIVGIDNNEIALKTFELNHPNSKGLKLDLGNPDFIEQLDKEIGKRSVDIVIGGPPCQGFSLTGKRDKEDIRNNLYKSIFICAKKYKPKAILIENVPGLKTLYNGDFYKLIIDEFEKMGEYNFKDKVLFAADYGIPQIRKRIFFIGIRKDIGEVSFPEPLRSPENYVTTREAIGDLPSLENEELQEKFQYSCDPQNQYQLNMREGSNGIYNHIITFHKEHVKNVIAQVPEGGNHKDLPEGVGNTRKFNEAWTRYDGDKPSKTIDTGHRNHFHYKYNRVPTVRENARLQSFPDKFIFLGTKTEQYKQSGNAVPPLLGYYLAKKIIEIIGEKNEKI